MTPFAAGAAFGATVTAAYMAHLGLRMYRTARIRPTARPR